MTCRLHVVVVGLLSLSHTACADDFCSDRQLEVRTGTACFEDSVEIFGAKRVRLAPEVADVDGDAHLDLVVLTATTTVQELSVARGDGRRGFTVDVVALGDSTDANSLVLADLDADGDLDIATASQTEICIVENDGEGAFSLAAQIEHAQSDMAAHDFDEDGQAELVLAGSTLDIAANMLSEMPSFTSVGSLIAGADSVVLADVDGDGTADAVATPGPVIFWGVAGGLSEADSENVNAGWDQFLLALDLDRDGIVDVASGDSALLGGSRSAWASARSIELEVPDDGPTELQGVLPQPWGDPSLVYQASALDSADGPACTELTVLLVEDDAAEPLTSARFGYMNPETAGLLLHLSVLVDLDEDGHVDLTDGSKVQFGRACAD